jgi:hypothetical protein
MARSARRSDQEDGAGPTMGASPRGWCFRSAIGWSALVFALICIVLEAGCGGDDPQRLGRRSTNETPVPSSDGGPAPPELGLSDAQALDWLRRSCAGCHGPKASGARDPIWSMPVTLTREWLEVTEATTAVYESLRRKALGTAGAFPPPMPPVKLDATAQASLADVLRWFEKKLPFTVAEADARYGRTPQPTPDVNFQCKTDATLRRFATRLTNAALERDPLPEELASFPENELDAVVTREQRAVLVSKLGGEWKQEFKATGLFKLANAIGTAGRIVTPSHAGSSGPLDALPPGVAEDLDGELYQLVNANYDNWDYSQYFVANTVMTTPRTAPLYGCVAGAPWQACDLRAPRNGFFTTLGFLNTRPQTFLSQYNNTGRVQAMYLTIVGEGMPRTGSPTNDAPALPACIDAADTRTAAGSLGGSGTASALQSGALCQGCHLGRGIAAGTVLFRPFSTTGLVYDVATLGAPGTPDAAAFAAATSAPWIHRSTPTGAAVQVDGAFLKGLLTAPPKACAPTGDPSGALAAITDVSQLATTFMADRNAFTRGFVRHAHRIFGTSEVMTLEMSRRVIASVAAGRSKVGHLVQAYFMADSYACGEAP